MRDRHDRSPHMTDGLREYSCRATAMSLTVFHSMGSRIRVAHSGHDIGVCIKRDRGVVLGADEE